MPIDLSNLTRRKAGQLPETLGELFDQLDRKATHEALRPVQIESLGLLDKQIHERDVVLKLGTGSGKTLVGLIYLEYMRRRHSGDPVVFLCPTLQLITQVLQSAAAIGITAETFPESGLPHRALDGKSVLVCTYDRLFNGKSVFETNAVRPSAIVLDDVHAGIDRVAGKYTLTLPSAAFEKLKALFAHTCSQLEPSVWRGITNNEVDTVYEVPFNVVQNHALEIGNILNEHKNDKELRFDITNVASYIEHTRICLSGARAEISLDVLPVEDVQSFSDTKHRLFMSASIKDGASLISNLGCDPDALKRVLEPPSDKGIGERLIIPIALVDPIMTREDVARICASLSQSTNVVVLCTSSKQTETWVSQGATYVQSADIDQKIARLKQTSRGNYVVFAQRFDGVDLADDACRVLVIDGTPSGEHLADHIDADRQRGSPGQNARAVNKFEQALGRAVRSSADYAVALLVGHNISAFLAQRNVKELLEPHTREQIELGKDIAELLIKETDSTKALLEVTTNVLIRDESWKETYRARISGVARQYRLSGQLTMNENIATVERDAWLKAKARNFQESTRLLQQLCDGTVIQKTQQAELLYKLAKRMHFVDSGKALSLHRSAYELSNLLPRPAELPDRKYARSVEQVGNIKAKFGEYSNPQGAVAALQELKAKLAFGNNAECVERALRDLGEFLGAASSRPEKETARGPDVLWLFDSVAFCIEAKNEKTSDISKNDAAQLLMSRTWCVTKLTESRQEIIATFATNATKFDRSEDAAFGPTAFTEKALFELVADLVRLVSALTFDGALFEDTAKISKLLSNSKLTAGSLKGRLLALG
jgi:Helicase C-terminal domain/Type III restriction enzyme, res subunit